MNCGYQHHNSCPFCGCGEVSMINSSLARCTGCEETMSYGFVTTLRQIRKLPNAKGKHACECGHPEMRRLPYGLYRCPSCNSEIDLGPVGQSGAQDLK